MKVISANIAHGLSLSPLTTVEGETIANLANELDADIVCLQEVDFVKSRSSNVDQTKLLAQAGGFVTARFFPALVGEPGRRADFRMPGEAEVLNSPADSYGVSILSRFPIVGEKFLQVRGSKLSLPMPFVIDERTQWRAIPDEPRIIGVLTLQTPSGVIDVLTTHLSFIPTRAIAQLFELKKLLGAHPVILAGDLNLAPIVTSRITNLSHAVTAPTYPRFRPRAQLDHILVSNHFQVKSSGSLELSVSDHLAVFAELTLTT